MHLDFTGLLRVVHVVKSLLHCFPQSQQTVVPQQQHLENTSVIQLIITPIKQQQSRSVPACSTSTLDLRMRRCKQNEHLPRL